METIREELERMGEEVSEEIMKRELSEHIKNRLGAVNNLHRPFWWREWDMVTKKKRVSRTLIFDRSSAIPLIVCLLQGLFKSFAILYTFGAHLEACGIHLEPNLADHCSPPPIGAMILSILAVRTMFNIIRSDCSNLK